MTEEEAKTKWCPMVRVFTDYPREGHVFNRRLDGNTVAALCIASDCMMWVPERQYSNGYEVVIEPGRCGLVK